MEKFLSALEAASKTLQTADHMVYITFPLIKDNGLLIKIFIQIYTAILDIVNAILQYDYAYKRIVLYNDVKANFKSFREKCAPRFGITPEEVKSIIEIFKVMEEHRQSPMEFVKMDKFVILSDSLQTDIVTIGKLKEYLSIAKNILQKATNRIRDRNKVNSVFYR
jgi:hypothetical protein